jgi:hypothetical protein
MHETKQVYYNQIRGEVYEINDADDFPSVALSVGHDVKRYINISFKTELMETFKNTYKLGDKVTIRFFVSSRKKYGRWYTMVNALEVI